MDTVDELATQVDAVNGRLWISEERVRFLEGRMYEESIQLFERMFLRVCTGNVFSSSNEISKRVGWG